MMKAEMLEFQDIDSLRGRSEATKASLVTLKQQYQARRDGMRQQMSGVSAKYEKIKNNLTENEVSSLLMNTRDFLP